MSGDPRAMEGQGAERLRVPRWLVIAGGLPLLAAMTAEFAAVVARNLGWNLTGSIELVQALILLASSVAMVAATLSRAHAKVSVFSRRYRGRSGRLMRILLAIGGATFFLALASGSAWIAWDMRHAAEQSELLGLPYLPLRIVVTAAMLVITVIYLRRIVHEVAAP